VAVIYVKHVVPPAGSISGAYFTSPLLAREHYLEVPLSEAVFTLQNPLPFSHVPSATGGSARFYISQVI